MHMNNLQKKAWSVGIFCGAVLGIYLIALAVWQFKSIAYVGEGIAPADTITISGTGDAYAVPDVATFSFSVTETAKAVSDAQSAATAKIAAALKAVRGAGVADADIQTVAYSIAPQYEYEDSVCPPTPAVPVMAPSDAQAKIAAASIGSADGEGSYCAPGKSVLTGYSVSETILVKVRDLDKAGDIFASIGSVGVQNVDGLDFSVDDPSAVQAKARAAAIADARSKADALAQELGVHIVRVASFSEDNGSYAQPMVYSMAVASPIGTKSAAPEVPTGQQKVTDTVSITYEIR
jgi:uncharacterized protein